MVEYKENKAVLRAGQLVSMHGCNSIPLLGLSPWESAESSRRKGESSEDFIAENPLEDLCKDHRSVTLRSAKIGWFLCEK